MKKFLFLIDAQTTPPVIVEALDNFFTTGKDAALYRAYDVWSEERLDAWEEIVDRLGIQQVLVSLEKNALDAELAKEAVELADPEIYDKVVLVSGLRELSPVAVRLKKTGLLVIGCGSLEGPWEFRDACDLFLPFERIVRFA